VSTPLSVLESWPWRILVGRRPDLESLKGVCDLSGMKGFGVVCAGAQLQQTKCISIVPLLRSQLRTTMSSNPSESLTRQLSEFSACEISDALIKLGSPNGGHIPDIHLVSPSGSTRVVCGPAYTVQMVFTSDTSAPKLPSHFLDAAPAGTVIVIDAPPSSVSWLSE
jgi:hypothetical protein